MKLFFITLSLWIPCSLTQADITQCPPSTVPVTGFAQSFLLDYPLKKAKITVLETAQTTTTDEQGHFKFCAHPKDKITLEIEKTSWLPTRNYKTTQSGTFLVPKTGFVGPYNDITFQVPSMSTYRMLKFILSEERGIHLDPKRCNVVTTVSAYHKTLKDDPQGIADATIELLLNQKIYNEQNTPFYFGIIDGKTDPFTPSLDRTSLDGGVLIYNLSANQSPYLITAVKSGIKFTTGNVWCRAGAFINLSPPQGPMAKHLKA